jgi:hypothetical protein
MWGYFGDMRRSANARSNSTCHSQKQGSIAWNRGHLLRSLNAVLERTVNETAAKDRVVLHPLVYRHSWRTFAAIHSSASRYHENQLVCDGPQFPNRIRYVCLFQWSLPLLRLAVHVCERVCAGGLVELDLGWCEEWCQVPCCLLGCFACARGFLILAREQRDSRVDALHKFSNFGSKEILSRDTTLFLLRITVRCRISWLSFFALSNGQISNPALSAGAQRGVFYSYPRLGPQNLEFPRQKKMSHTT